MNSALYQEYLNMPDEMLLAALSDNNELLGCIYKKHKEYCIKFMRSKLAVQDDDLVADIYQDAVIVLYEKVKQGNFKLTNGAKIQTYLNSICYFQLINQVKKSQNTISYDSQPLFDNEDENNTWKPEFKNWLPQDNSDINSERVKAIEQGLNLMKGDKRNCYELLNLFYYQNKTMLQIAEHFGETNPDNVKAQKHKCKKTLEKLTFEILKNIR